MAGIDFEPEIEFPPHPVDAARVFLASMAYPERGAGMPGGIGVPFCESLWSRIVWAHRKARGLRAVREDLNDPEFKPPERSEFERAYLRGKRRLKRRSAAYSLVGEQMINGFFSARAAASRLVAEGREGEAYALPAGAKFRPIAPELWVQNTQTPRQVIRRNPKRWAAGLDLNATGSPADEGQKIKDLVRRGYIQSRPVLHMAHAFNEACTEVAPKLPGWGTGDPILAMLLNSEKWIWGAIETANNWRDSSRYHLTPYLEPDHMIVLRLPKNLPDNAPYQPAG